METENERVKADVVDGIEQIEPAEFDGRRAIASSHDKCRPNRRGREAKGSKLNPETPSNRLAG